MDKEIQRNLRQLMNKGALVNGAPTSETYNNTDDSLEQISDNVGQPQDRANFPSVETMIGVPDAVNSSLDDILRTGYDSSAIAANADGSALERLEDIALDITRTESMVLADYDDFDVADADANTERWDVGYINGTEGGSADINTTTAGQLRISVDPDATPTAAAYGVNLAQPIVSKYFTTIVDVNVSSFGTPNVSWASLGIRVSPLVYDANNIVYAQRQSSSGGVGNRIAVGATFNAVAQGEQYFTSSDTSVAFKIERWDNVWRCYYSLSQYPDYVWVLLAQYEDPSEFMDAQQSVYLDAYSPGNADAQTAVGDFDNFKLYENIKGVSQQVSGDYDGSAVAANEDGSLAERLEQIQEATNRGTGSSLPADKSLYDILGTTYVDGGGAFNADSVWDDLRTIGQYLIDGTAGNEAGTILPAGKSLRDILGIEYVDAGGNPDVDSIRDHLVAFLGRGTGTALPANKALYDILGASYVDAGGAFNVDSIWDDLRTIGQYLIDGTAGAEAGTVLPAGNSLYDGLAGNIAAVNRIVGKAQIIEVSVTSAANAGNVILATVTAQPCLIKSIVIHADTASQADLTSAAVYGGAANVVVFIDATEAAVANINAVDEQVAWTGAARFAATKTIIIDLLGTGVTPVDLTVTIEYEACINGGYLA